MHVSAGRSTREGGAHRQSARIYGGSLSFLFYSLFLSHSRSSVPLLFIPLSLSHFYVSRRSLYVDMKMKISFLFRCLSLSFFVLLLSIHIFLLLCLIHDLYLIAGHRRASVLRQTWLPHITCTATAHLLAQSLSYVCSRSR